MDVSTGLTILGGAIGSAKVVEKILGPTSEYLGDGLKNWTEQRVKNIGRIFENAQKKLGGKIDEEGSVNPKVLKGILSEGSFCDDELVAEYFGGVLASSRSEVSRDDRGASFVALLSRLTSYQVRSHFLIYSSIKNLFNGETDISVSQGEGRRKLEIYIPLSAYGNAMEFSEKESISTILPHVLFGLARENLIEQNFQYGNSPQVIKYGNVGIVCTPSALGVELFLWGQGMGNTPINNLLKSDVQFQDNIEIQKLDGIISLESERKKAEEARKQAEEINKRLKPEF